MVSSSCLLACEATRATSTRVAKLPLEPALPYLYRSSRYTCELTSTTWVSNVCVAIIPKMTDQSAELVLNVDTITGSVHTNCLEDLRNAPDLQQHAKETLVLDGLDIVAHRLFGPQPHTATYLCIWDIHIARVMAHLTSVESKILAAANTAFVLNFTDPLNAPAPEYDIPADPDGKSS